MKKLFLAVALLLGLVFGSFAQNRSIAFEETKVWKEIIEKAKAEKKLIFVDCYTDWCAPCKYLAAEVFTQDKVADFFNKNFVNAKFEMEKDADAAVVNSLFKITAYPTLLFVDPVTENLAHRLVGGGKADWLIAAGQTAMDPEKNLIAMKNRYNLGDRTPKFLDEYLSRLQAAWMKDEYTKTVEEYLNSNASDQLSTKKRWNLIRTIPDPLSKPVREVMANRQKYYDIVGQDIVNGFLTKSIIDGAEELAIWNNTNVNKFDTARNTELTRYLQSIDFPVAALALTYLETAEIIRKNDWKGLVKKIREVDNSNLYPGEPGENYFNFFIQSLEFSDDKNLVSEGLKMIDEKIVKIKTGEDDYDFRMSSFLNSKYILYMAIDDEENGCKAKLESEEYLEKSGYYL